MSERAADRQQRAALIATDIDGGIILVDKVFDCGQRAIIKSQLARYRHRPDGADIFKLLRVAVRLVRLVVRVSIDDRGGIIDQDVIGSPR